MRTHSFLLSITLLLAIAAACGVKSSPQPPLGGTPSQVQHLEAKPRENGILLTWEIAETSPELKFTTAVAFEIGRGSKVTENSIWSDYEVVGTTAMPTSGNLVKWRDEKIESGIQYRYRVCAIDSGGHRSPYSKIVSTRWEQPPGAPIEFAAEPGDRAVNMRWTPPAEGPEVEGYFVYRATGDKDFRLISRMPAPNPAYFDAGLENGITYRYVVRAARAAGTILVEGPASEVLEVVPADRIAPQVPVGVGAFIRTGGVKVLWWPNNEDDLEGYHIYRRHKRKTERLTDSPIKTNEYTDTTAVRRQHYRYTVTAVDDAGNESPHSETAKAFVK